MPMSAGSFSTGQCLLLMPLLLLLKYCSFCLPHSDKFLLVIWLQNKTKKEGRHHLSTACSEYSPDQPRSPCLESGCLEAQGRMWGVLIHSP